jgi:hypothetical protein
MEAPTNTELILTEV